MFVQRKEFERDFARRYRGRGYPLRTIAAELGVALSSVSVWVRDVPVPEAPRPDPLAADDLVDEGRVGTRRCGRCRTVLPLSAFNRNGDDFQWWCRDCFREYFRRRGDLHREQCRAGKRKRRAKASKFIQEYLSTHACVDCGESDPVVLEFDHLGEKWDDISRLAYHGYSVEALRSELRGCEIVCVNCHRRRTAHRSGWRREDWRNAPALLLPAAARNTDYVYSLLEASGCVDCGLTDLCALDFDHVGEKRGNVSKLARDGCSLERLVAEIEQCEVRCANCHRRRTARQRSRVRSEG